MQPARIFLSVFLILSAVSTVWGRPKVEPGIDVLAANNFKGLEGKRIGLITNPTGISASGISTIEILRHAPNLKLVALYAPEHGVYGSDYAGDYVPSSIDQHTGLPVYSLYGPTRKPSPDMLKGIDVLVYDIQDIGCRSYTFISTMGLAMEAAGEAGIEFYVLDRPNPLGGNRVEGMPLDPQFRSFVGEWDIPYVYGLTPGELARMINGEKWITKRPRLTIVPMRHWRRSMSWDETGLLWVPSSPNVPTAETALYYVATGLIGELGQVSTGIGYTQPFMLIGHPSFDSFALADRLAARKLPGILFRPTFYKPFAGSMKGDLVQGVQLHITNRDTVNLSNLGVLLLEDVQSILGNNIFGKATSEQIDIFDKVAGGDELRKHFLAGLPAQDLIASWQPSLKAFRQLREKYLIYETVPAGSLSTPSKSKPAEKPTNSTP